MRAVSAHPDGWNRDRCERALSCVGSILPGPMWRASSVLGLAGATSGQRRPEVACPPPPGCPSLPNVWGPVTSTQGRG